MPETTRTVAVPERIAALPRDDHGRPVPWFTARPAGKPDLRTMDAAKIPTAIGEHRCWICGQPFEPAERPAFIVGPFSLFSRVASEPPSHRFCALYALRECPFLSNPQRARRPANLPEGATMAGTPILDNPGVVLMWTCSAYRVERLETGGGVLLRLPEPLSIVAYHGGLPALRNHLDDAFTAAADRARVELADAGAPAEVIDSVVATNRQLLNRAVMCT